MALGVGQCMQSSTTSLTYFSLNMYAFNQYFFGNSAKFVSGPYKAEIDHTSAVEFT